MLTTTSRNSVMRISHQCTRRAPKGFLDVSISRDVSPLASELPLYEQDPLHEPHRLSPAARWPPLLKAVIVSWKAVTRAAWAPSLKNDSVCSVEGLLDAIPSIPREAKTGKVSDFGMFGSEERRRGRPFPSRCHVFSLLVCIFDW